MIYGAILAGGKGKRMGYTEMPKQFLTIGEKPIIIHTLEKFLLNDRFRMIYIGCIPDWIAHTRDIVAKYIGENDRIVICEGGGDRNGTIMNIISRIDNDFGLSDDDVIVTHDAVRPFVTHRIINDNIDAAVKYGFCDTVIPASDTIVRSDNNAYITDIPDRSKMYQGQTPQSFNINMLRRNYESLSTDEKHILTDACKICVLKGDHVQLVMGEVFNIKITTAYDLKIADIMVKGDIYGD